VWIDPICPISILQSIIEFLGNFVWIYQKSFMNILVIKILKVTSKGMIFVSFFFDFFMYVDRESLSVDLICPHLLSPCMCFSPKVYVCGNAKLIQVCLLFFYCILLCTYSIYHVHSWYSICPWYETLTYPHTHAILNDL
jgi:hypothetical protein